MALNKGMDVFLDRRAILRRRGTKADPWRFQWPNTADFNFNYAKLLQDAARSSIGKNTNPSLRIAVIGAGIGGLTAARELFRSGYTNLDIYEASERIGGRTYSIPAPGQHTCFEMGAMRMPLFTEPGGLNSVLGYYTDRFRIAHSDFPNPGSPAAYDTGIYINDGHGPAPDLSKPPQLLIWPRDQQAPPTPELAAVFYKWMHFAEMFAREVAQWYGRDDWEERWHSIVSWYWEMNFRDLVFEDAIEAYDARRPGYFGGLGMTEAESNLFYTIGAGDGAWGAFYDISCLYVMRTLLFGYGTDLQLIEGLFDEDGSFRGGPRCGVPGLDDLGNSFAGPDYVGIETYTDCLFFQPVVSDNVVDISLFDALNSPHYDVNLYTRNPVTSIRRNADGRIAIGSAGLQRDYDAVVLTPTTWATERSMGVDFAGFDAEQWPFAVRNSFRVSHWIRSCKVFYPLKERYWGPGKPIPQIISTDNQLQGVYGYALDGEPGVLMVSYTWEDGASKFLADDDDDALARELFEYLDAMLVRSTNIGVPISPYVDPSSTAVIHWERMPTYRGCAKLYRERSWNDNYALLRYNQETSRRSGIYFAGEAFSVEGGWTEPALRGGLDAVIQIIRNTGGQFRNGFDYARDYPRYSTWSPVRSPKKLVVG
ncbi:MAG: FAD-dependent oxidoreductase [Myxococcota bacterium]